MTGQPGTKAAGAIGDYALIGDCRSAALVSRTGSIDWLCLPDFSSPSVFAALLDPDRGGRLLVRPAAEFTMTRRYRDGTGILETTFETATGRARLTDCMPLGDDARTLRPQRQVLRVIDGLDGEIAFEVRFEPRPDYARRRPSLRQCGDNTVVWRCGEDCMWVHGDAAMEVDRGGDSAVGRPRLRAGERSRLALAWSKGEIGVIPGADELDRHLDETAAWWGEWSAGCRYAGRHRDAVVRSALTLKLLSSALSGALIAAPTTSLPEVPGGALNWDYRYCWLRDASLTLRVFIELGYPHEAARFLDWLLYTTQLTRPRLEVVYDLFGRRPVPEKALPHLSGWGRARPVRVGNGAGAQRQHDVYGAVVLAACQYVRSGGSLKRSQKRMLVNFGRQVLRDWREPDSSIWELRGGPRHYTYSKLMCWAALDGLLELGEACDLPLDRDRLSAGREAIRELVETRGYNASLGSYVSVIDGDMPDVSLLAIARTGFHAADHPRMTSTWRFIERTLGDGPFLHRFPSGSAGEGQEGAMLLTSFWAVDYLVRAGRREEAEARFDRLLNCRNDVGLLAEQWGVQTDQALGNFPQAYSHVALITAAFSLGQAGHGAGGD